jgi:integrase
MQNQPEFNMDSIIASSNLPSILPLLDQLPLILSTSELNGSSGTNRELKEFCQLNASNDLEAIYAWLDEYRTSHPTYRTYQKEAERFLLWCIYQKQKALSSMLREDIEEYSQFLVNPQPADVWCQGRGGRGYKRGSSKWKPFTGPLSASAKATALSALKSLYSYLTAGRYLSFNPFSIMRSRNKTDVKTAEDYFRTIERTLEPDEWEAMLETLDNYPEVTFEQRCEKERLVFLVSILFCLGLRVNELVQHRWNSFRKQEERWWFYLVGKGSKPARIPVNDELLRAVIRYRLFLHIPPLPMNEDKSALIPSLHNGEAITARQINVIIKKLASATAKKFSHLEEKQKKLKKFSAHWFRHLSATWQNRMGVQYVQQNMRHQNKVTTERYIHLLDEERHNDMQKLRLTLKK